MSLTEREQELYKLGLQRGRGRADAVVNAQPLRAEVRLPPPPPLEVNVPAPRVEVTNQVPAPTVNVAVDVDPFADAVDRLAAVIDSAADRIAEAVAEAVADAVADALAQRQPRTLRITHSDGTESTAEVG